MYCQISQHKESPASQFSVFCSNINIQQNFLGLPVAATHLGVHRAFKVVLMLPPHRLRV